MPTNHSARTITVTASPTGEITVEAHGFKGKGCQDATEAIETALGIVANRKKKPEYTTTNTGKSTQTT
jgi:hypothetical protein